MDRNSVEKFWVSCSVMSLSARRAWIEMVKLFRQNYECFVALRKESVDRNSRGMNIIFCIIGRSPQGERG